MVSKLLEKVFVSTTVGAAIGFSTILGAINSASALTVESESFNKNGKQQEISHIAFFVKDNSGNVTKVKIDSVSGTKSYDATNFLKTYYPDSEVVAYQVKASNKKSFVALSEGYSEDNLPTKENSADVTYQYSQVSNLPEPKPQQPEEKPSSNQVDDSNSTEEKENYPKPKPKFVVAPSTQTNSSSQTVSVPEPGSIGAIVIFGLGGLLRKKKKSS
ncbi:MAG: PEP-CTERM sorting domain-containing protein [Rivularia sp. (in: Bacteria)]|nr:PEP-CTERM sorting domain-containing protein [Rivularia sp. MS3]